MGHEEEGAVDLFIELVNACVQLKEEPDAKKREALKLSIKNSKALNKFWCSCNSTITCEVE